MDPIVIVQSAPPDSEDKKTLLNDVVDRISCPGNFDSSAPKTNGLHHVKLEPQNGENCFPPPKKTISLNRNAILSLQNCLKKIGETRKSSEETSPNVVTIKLEDNSSCLSDDATSNSSRAISECSDAASTSGKLLNEGSQQTISEPSVSITECHIGLKRKRTLLPPKNGAKPASSLCSDLNIPKVAQTKRSRKKRKKDQTNHGPDPFATTVIEEFLEKAWLSYAFCTKGEQLIFEKSDFKYSLSAAEIPKPLISVLSYTDAEVSSSTFLKPRELKAKLKQLKLAAGPDVIREAEGSGLAEVSSEACPGESGNVVNTFEEQIRNVSGEEGVFQEQELIGQSAKDFNFCLKEEPRDEVNLYESNTTTVWNAAEFSDEVVSASSIEPIDFAGEFSKIDSNEETKSESPVPQIHENQKNPNCTQLSEDNSNTAGTSNCFTKLSDNLHAEHSYSKQGPSSWKPIENLGTVVKMMDGYELEYIDQLCKLCGVEQKEEDMTLENFLLGVKAEICSLEAKIHFQREAAKSAMEKQKNSSYYLCGLYSAHHVLMQRKKLKNSVTR